MKIQDFFENVNKGIENSNNLNIIKSMGLERDENAYSDIIAHLLLSNLGIVLIKNILSHYNILVPNYVSDEESYTVLREYHRIDITIIFEKPKLIIGIENKIGAEEQETQLKRYQKVFDNYYTNYNRFLFFLTPNGRNSLTKDESSKTPCYNMSYSTLVDIMIRLPNQDEITKPYISTFTNCIRNEVIMENSNTAEFYKIWGNLNNRNVLNELNKNRPGIYSIKNLLIKKISEYLISVGDKINDIWEYPTKNPTKELDIWPQSFKNKGIPIAFMFYDIEERENLPCMRVTIWKDDFNQISASKLEKYKMQNDSFAFEPIRGWSCWISLYAGRNFSPDYKVTIDHDYGEGLVKLFTDRFIAEYEELLKYI
ncbi:MAG: PD-(D/E)XK nuclease family protein [Eubacteriales bacterium]